MQKITPFLWFDKEAEEAVKFYTSLFPNSKIVSTQYYPEGSDDPHMKGMEGKVLTAVFELNGYRFMALDGGPIFQKNPSISFYINCKEKEEVDRLWQALSEGGKVLMELQRYDFSEYYGWCQDKYGVSWQLFMGTSGEKIMPCLMFTQDVNGKAQEAMEFYTSLFPDSNIDMSYPYPPEAKEKEGTVMHAMFTLAGQKFIAMDGGTEHEFTFNEGISLYVDCDGQEEVDRLWEKLSASPENEQCGWCKDKYGVSWQIIPRQLGELMEKDKSGKVMAAMMQMHKIEVNKLQEAFEGK